MLPPSGFLGSASVSCMSAPWRCWTFSSREEVHTRIVREIKYGGAAAE